MLLNYNTLIHEDPNLRDVLKATSFIPVASDNNSGTRLSRCCDVYDPENDEIVHLLNNEHLPLSTWCSNSTILVVLRQLGLKNTLDRSTIIDIINNIEINNDYNKSKLLLRYLDTHASRLFATMKKERKSLRTHT